MLSFVKYEVDIVIPVILKILEKINSVIFKSLLDWFITLLFWFLNIFKNINPNEQNKVVLNKAWAIICNVASFKLLMEIIIMIILICLIVENAITFFMSISMLARSPPRRNVLNLIAIRIVFKDSSNIGFLIFIFKKIPAVTNVDEWTIAEMGVGADIAAGSQDDIGIWALFVSLQAKININMFFLHLSVS